MNTFAFRGEAAEIRWGYHSAARLESWEFQPRPDGAVITARVVSADAFRLSQPALMFVIPRPSGPWEFPVQSLQQAGTSLTATVGPQKA